MLNARVDEVGEGRQEASAAFTDLRKLLEDKSIDAISIATPNHNHTPADHLGVPGGQRRLRGEALLARHVRGEADCGGGAEVQPAGAARHQQPLEYRARGHPAHAGWPDRRRLHGARPVLQMARHHRPQARRAGARGRALRPVAGAGARSTSSPRTASTTTGTGSGITATATWATRASIRSTWRAGAWA